MEVVVFEPEAPAEATTPPDFDSCARLQAARAVDQVVVAAPVAMAVLMSRTESKTRPHCFLWSRNSSWRSLA